MRIAALIVAAGRGFRANGGAPGATPKQYASIGGAPVLWYTIRAFAGHPLVGDVQVVIHPDDIEFYREAVPVGASSLWPPVFGGPTRQVSVHAGLEALSALKPDGVLIHDGARPFVSAAVIENAITALLAGPAAIAAVPLADTLKEAGPDNNVVRTIDRRSLWRAQTPQAFRTDVILEAHRKAAAQDRDDFTDDAALAEWAGIPVTLVEGSTENVKLTTADEISAADRKLRSELVQPYETRTASGFDVHRFTLGDHVWLCGVKIPHTHKLEGHSDADVALHALTDALLGTIGDGDIGQHFPPTDPQWRGAASSLFLEDARKRVAARQGRIINVDVTILAEAPRIGPHRTAMQAAIAQILRISTDRVGVKATTTEQLGFTGRREGIVALATATVALPVSSGGGQP